MCSVIIYSLPGDTRGVFALQMEFISCHAPAGWRVYFARKLGPGVNANKATCHWIPFITGTLQLRVVKGLSNVSAG